MRATSDYMRASESDFGPRWIKLIGSNRGCVDFLGLPCKITSEPKIRAVRDAHWPQRKRTGQHVFNKKKRAVGSIEAGKPR